MIQYIGHIQNRYYDAILDAIVCGNERMNLSDISDCHIVIDDNGSAAGMQECPVRCSLGIILDPVSGLIETGFLQKLIYDPLHREEISSLAVHSQSKLLSLIGKLRQRKRLGDIDICQFIHPDILISAAEVG